MRTMKCTLISIMIIGLVLQGLIGQVFAADTGDEIAKLNAVSRSEDLLNQTAGEALPSPIIPLNSDEETVLLSLENSNQALLEQKAAGGTATTRCSTDPNSGERSCKTVYEEDSPSYNGDCKFCNPVGAIISVIILGVVISTL